MSALFDRSYTCQICGKDFTSKQVKTSAIRAKERKKDFHTIFNGENPTFYGVICCPNCGYTKFENDFKQEITAKCRDTVKNTITKSWKVQDFTKERDINAAIKVHLIALVNYNVLKEKQAIIGKLLLRLAWFYEEAGNTSENMKYVKLALDAFIKSFELEKQEDAEEKELEIIYLIGELNRQLGNYKEAIRWYDMVVKHEFAYKNRLIKGYAKEQWALAAEEYSLSKKNEPATILTTNY
ncbi:DUF2225 domain-containing protein [Fusibacter bizertensis]|uniref:DUF2225 domain-containing protein n=1 Tax=Fusibacter bizertensis TaxID=1488331 RepID=A0ABT6N9X8_9FIRM|nr:DUF2225 domain-containing protein [Fusibacter bizertensis]MDH8677222.1 DUF2225 domain-containing protein [Fusibacter bizertensis]